MATGIDFFPLSTTLIDPGLAVTILESYDSYLQYEVNRLMPTHQDQKFSTLVLTAYLERCKESRIIDSQKATIDWARQNFSLSLLDRIAAIDTVFRRIVGYCESKYTRELTHLKELIKTVESRVGMTIETIPEPHVPVDSAARPLTYLASRGGPTSYMPEGSGAIGASKKTTSSDSVVISKYR